MTDKCSCTPGSEENGWHEDRCEVCRQHELDQWRLMLENWNKLKRSI